MKFKDSSEYQSMVGQIERAKNELPFGDIKGESFAKRFLDAIYGSRQEWEGRFNRRIQEERGLCASASTRQEQPSPTP